MRSLSTILTSSKNSAFRPLLTSPPISTPGRLLVYLPYIFTVLVLLVLSMHYVISSKWVFLFFYFFFLNRNPSLESFYTLIWKIWDWFGSKRKWKILTRVYEDEEEWFRAIFAGSKREDAIQNQYEFFVQRMGGPSLYSQRRGTACLLLLLLLLISLLWFIDISFDFTRYDCWVWVWELRFSSKGCSWNQLVNIQWLSKSAVGPKSDLVCLFNLVNKKVVIFNVIVCLKVRKVCFFCTLFWSMEFFYFFWMIHGVVQYCRV